MIAWLCGGACCLQRCLGGNVFAQVSFVTWLVFCFLTLWVWVCAVESVLVTLNLLLFLPCILSARFRLKSWLVFFRERLCGSRPRALWERFESVLYCGCAEILRPVWKWLWLLLWWSLWSDSLVTCLVLSFPFSFFWLMRDWCWVAVHSSGFGDFIYLTLYWDDSIWSCCIYCLSCKLLLVWIRCFFWRSSSDTNPTRH